MKYISNTMIGVNLLNNNKLNWIDASQYCINNFNAQLKIIITQDLYDIDDDETTNELYDVYNTININKKPIGFIHDTGNSYLNNKIVDCSNGGFGLRSTRPSIFYTLIHVDIIIHHVKQLDMH